MPKRKAASVLPEPVGAWISACFPVAIAGQPRACAGVGSVNVRSNQARVSVLKGASGSMPPSLALALASAVHEIHRHRDREHDHDDHADEEADAGDRDQRRPGAASFFRLPFELLRLLDRMLEGLDDLLGLVDRIGHTLDNTPAAAARRACPCASTSKGSAAPARAHSLASWPNGWACLTWKSTRFTMVRTGRRRALRSCRHGCGSSWRPRRTAG